MLTQQISLKPDTDNLPDFQAWRKVNDHNFSLLDYLFGAANIEIAIAFTKLFSPDFIEYKNGIFLAAAFDENIYNQWQSQLGNDLNAIERVMNHQHINDLLAGGEKVGIKNLIYLGQAIKQMWENHLKLVYPHKSFEVSCTQDENTVIVTFHQIRLIANS